MFSVSHMIVLFVVVLVVVCPHKLPELARGLGKLMAEFRKASTDFKLAFEEEMRNVERQGAGGGAQEAGRNAAATSAATQRRARLAPQRKNLRPNCQRRLKPVVAPVNEAVARGTEELGSTEILDAAKSEDCS